MNPLVSLALTLFVGAAGGVLFHLLSFPAAFLTGSAVAVVFAVVAGIPMRLPDALRSPALACVGVMMGASVSPDQLRDVAALPVGVLGVVLATAGATVASYLVLRRLARWDALSAMCGSIPGAFALVMALSAEQGARMERVIIAQALRLFILVSIIPLVFGHGEGGALPTAEGDFGLAELALVMALAFGSWGLARLLRLSAGIMIGPLIVTAALSATGVIDLAIPAWFAAAAFTVLGASVAARFKSVTRGEIVRLAGASLAAFAAAFVAAMALAVAFAQLVDEPLGAVFLAFAPGGVDAMIALSFLLGFDVTFVTVLHITRLIVLSAATPFLVGWAKREASSVGIAPPAPPSGKDRQ